VLEFTTLNPGGHDPSSRSDLGGYHGYTYSTRAWAKTLSHTQAVGVAKYLRASLKRLGYKRALRIVIRHGRVRSQALSRRVTMAVTLG
jgi:hypothetical protein